MKNKHHHQIPHQKWLTESFTYLKTEVELEKRGAVEVRNGTLSGGFLIQEGGVMKRLMSRRDDDEVEGSSGGGVEVDVGSE